MTFEKIVHCLPAADQKVIGSMMTLFEDIDRQTEKFAAETGLKCKNGCGACCTNPDIEATVAEVLPLAVHLWSQGKVVSVPTFPSNGVCVFYRPDPVIRTQGRCSVYAYRPGLCRLFGFAARPDKHGKPVLVTCKVIKDSQPQACTRTQEELHRGFAAPSLAAHAFCVSNIDPVHGQKLLPINLAIRRACEKVGYILEKLKQ